VRTISDMLSNEKYAGDSTYGKTTIAEYPSMRQVRNDSDKVSRSEKHHPAIIDKSLFDRVQELRLLRTNMETDERETEYEKVPTTAFVPRVQRRPRKNRLRKKSRFQQDIFFSYSYQSGTDFT